jgi:hypothetical protein
MATKKTITTSFVHPYKQGSKGAKVLAEALKAKRILVGGRSSYKHSASKRVINWGSSTYHVAKGTPMFNPPEAVNIASNKLTFFQQLDKSSVNLVPWTTEQDKVQEWLDDCSIVCVRQKLRGHSAEGLIIIDPEDVRKKELDIPPAKLYTRYIPKVFEYRVHVFQGEVIRVQKKILEPELSERLKDPNDPLTKYSINWQVRNRDNGFIYVTEGVEEDCPPQVLQQAQMTLKLCGLDFGAVDVIYNGKKQKAFVLEINTSPGLEGGTVDAYVEAFSKSQGPLMLKPIEKFDNPYEYKIEELYSLVNVGREDTYETRAQAWRDYLRNGTRWVSCFGWQKMERFLEESGLPEIQDMAVEQRKDPLRDQLIQALVNHDNSLQ